MEINGNEIQNLGRERQRRRHSGKYSSINYLMEGVYLFAGCLPVLHVRGARERRGLARVEVNYKHYKYNFNARRRCSLESL